MCFTATLIKMQCFEWGICTATATATATAPKNKCILLKQRRCPSVVGGLLLFDLVGLPPFLFYWAFVPNCIESIQVVFRFPVAVSSLFSLHIIDFFVYAAVFSVLIAASKFIFIL